MLFAGLTWSTGQPEDDDVWLLLLAGGCLLLAAAVSTKAAAEALEVAVPSGFSVCATGQPAAAAALATSSAATILDAVAWKERSRAPAVDDPVHGSELWLHASRLLLPCRPTRACRLGARMATTCRRA